MSLVSMIYGVGGGQTDSRGGTNFLLGWTNRLSLRKNLNLRNVARMSQHSVLALKLRCQTVQRRSCVADSGIGCRRATWRADCRNSF